MSEPRACIKCGDEFQSGGRKCEQCKSESEDQVDYYTNLRSCADIVDQDEED